MSTDKFHLGGALTLPSAVFSQLWWHLMTNSIPERRFLPLHLPDNIYRDNVSANTIYLEGGKRHQPPYFIPRELKRRKKRHICVAAAAQELWAGTSGMLKDARTCLQTAGCWTFEKLIPKGHAGPFVPAGIPSPPLALLMGFPCY